MCGLGLVHPGNGPSELSFNLAVDPERLRYLRIGGGQEGPLVTGNGTVRIIVICIVQVGIATLLHDRTTYVYDFARADKLGFRHLPLRLDFDPQKGAKSSAFGQNMLPEPDIFSYTTQVAYFL